MRRSLAIAVLFGLAGLVASATARANPLDIYGYGARNIGLAGAVTATVNDSTANYYNPANLAAARYLIIDVGYRYSGAFLRLDGHDNNVDPSRGLQAGMVIPGRIGRVRFGLGAAIFLPDERISRVRALPQQQPRWVLYDNRPQRLHITTNAGIEVDLGRYGVVRAGGGISYLTDTGGGLTFTGRLFKEAQRGLLGVEVNVDFKTVRYPSAGLTWQSPGGTWSLALVYRGESRVELDLAAHVIGDIALGSSLLSGSFDLSSFNTNLFAPHQWFLGAAWAATPNLTLTADVGYLAWSRYPPSSAKVDFQLSIVGLSLKLPKPTDIVDPGFHDIVTVRLGGEYRFVLNKHVTTIVRAGYAFEPTPAPEQSGITNYVDSSKHVFAAGVGVDLSQLTSVMPHPLSLDIGAQYIFLMPRDHLKQSPVDRVGDYRSSGGLLTVAATMTLRFR